MQATLVALYGDKHAGVKTFLADCQDKVADILGKRFRRYDIRQIHGTIIGLEKDDNEPHSFHNRNFRVCRDIMAPMDFSGLLDFFRNGQHFPFQLQIGGFKNCDYPFVSRGERPFKRAFSIQGGNVVIIGWPLGGSLPVEPPCSSPASTGGARLYPATLDVFRRGAQRYGFLHTYHAKPGGADNDFFFRIGVVDDPKSLSLSSKSHVEDKMRGLLAKMPPLLINVELSDLSVVFYDSEELPLTGSTAVSLDNGALNETLIRSRCSG